MRIKKSEMCCETCNNNKTDKCLGCGNFKHYEPTAEQKEVIKCIRGLQRMHMMLVKHREKKYGKHVHNCGGN
jgi:hypothetical protein